MKRESQHQALGMLLGVAVGLCGWSWSAGQHRRAAARAAQRESMADPHQLFMVAAELEHSDPYSSIKIFRKIPELRPSDAELRRRVQAELRGLGTDLDGQVPGQ